MAVGFNSERRSHVRVTLRMLSEDGAVRMLDLKIVPIHTLIVFEKEDRDALVLKFWANLFGVVLLEHQPVAAFCWAQTPPGETIPTF